ncbi:MAG TPA: hypothetical protein PK052_10705 [Anaerohalosphaeraceae bacterium]|nr:hypothetical protein [Anaerohalosphaeraceae bacterium]HPC64230.1 hypothetical protein [Anaerohalosphaeraceae bacterium]HRS72179.1 hypothetical protein [Anaerohalosphaeraceae bacterium]HRV18954.1 hypothetical protein [Anaerohalosphaeraceae bacterium]
MKTLMYSMLCVAVIAGLAGCTCPGAAPAPAPAPAPKPAPAPAPAPAPQAAACGNYTVSQDYMQSGAIRIEKVMPAMVQLNAPFEYTIKVTNLTDMTLADVEIRERIPASLKNISSSPAGKMEGGTAVWKMDTLGPRAVEKIVVKGSASETGCLQTCANATYTILACANTQVVQPALALTKTAPASVTICDPIPLQFTVSNKGSGTATNVKLTDTLPAGLTTQDGKTSIELALGNLAPGQSVSRTVVAKAAKTGTYKNQAAAVADGDLKAQSETTTTVVTQPVLAIQKTGPKKIYIGRSMEYEITVANKGDSAANQVVLTDTVPAGVTGVKVSDGGTVAGSQITWNIGTLAPNASKKVTVSYSPTGGGEFCNTTKAVATCAEAVTAQACTTVEGIPAVLLEVIDVSDPIEVGGNETYIITVTNQGSAQDTNISIKAMLEESMQYVSSSGATSGSFADGTVTFAPLPNLAPKAKATWQVVVKAVKPGDVRFKVVMNTDQLSRSVEETEATHFYQ